MVNYVEMNMQLPIFENIIQFIILKDYDLISLVIMGIILYYELLCGVCSVFLFC